MSAFHNRLIAAALLLLGSLAAAAPSGLDTLADLVAQEDVFHPAREAIPVDSPATFDEFLARIDPYAARLTRPEYDRLSGGASRRDFGIGAAMFEYSRKWRWVRYRAGPAAKAGLPEEAELAQIDDKPIPAQISHEQLNTMLHKSSSPVTMRFAGVETEFHVPKANYDRPTVEAWRVGSAQVIRVFDFVEGHTATAIERALADARGGPVVLDLRYSTGGNLFEAFDTTGLFLSAGTPVGGTIDAAGNRREFTAPERKKRYDGALTVLTSPITASAAEVLIAALRHHSRARVAGTPTFGKCVAQRLFPLGADGAIRLSVARLLAPSGRDCDGPLMPDLAVVEARIFDIQWIFDQALGLVKPASVMLVCEARPFDTEAAARERAAEIRLSMSIGDIATVLDGVVSERGDEKATRLCFGPFTALLTADPFRRRLAEKLGREFEMIQRPSLPPDVPVSLETR